MLKFPLAKEVKVNVTIDNIRLKSNSTTNKTIGFTKKTFFFVFLGFTQSHSGQWGDIDGFVQLTPGSYKSDKPIDITGVDKVHLKADCFQGSIVNSVRKPILNSFALSPPPSRKICKEPTIELFKKIKRSVLSHLTFYIEDDGHKPVDFHNETVRFDCQLIKIQKVNEPKYDNTQK